MTGQGVSGKRLSKYLASAGVASRRACEELIFAGKVTVNGQVVLQPQFLVAEADKVVADGKPVGGEEGKVYYILNKPVGYVCTQARRGQEKLVLDLFAEESHRLFTVGRLDKNTAGLLLVTNDGDFANAVIHPSKRILKEYLVKADAEVTYAHLTALSAGALVDGDLVKPHAVKKVRRNTVKIVIAEGRKHEVRLLFQAVGLGVRELTRIRIGGLLLGRLPLGAYRLLSEKERSALFG